MFKQFEYKYGSADWSCFSAEFTMPQKTNSYLDSLNYYSAAYETGETPIEQNSDLHFISGIYKKFLFRGVRTYMQPEVEELLFQQFPRGLRPSRNADEPHSVSYRTPDGLLSRYLESCSLSCKTPLPVVNRQNPFDPDNPENEFRLYKQLIEVAGERIAGYVYPQCPLDQLLPSNVARSFLFQRLDFLIVLPNGKGLILEPGDHGANEAQRDREREHACRKNLEFETLRIDNCEIGSATTAKLIGEALKEIGAEKFLGESNTLTDLLLSPIAVHRIESTLLDALLNRNLLQKQTLSIAVCYGNATCTTIAVYSFLKRLQALFELYGITDFKGRSFKLTCLGRNKESPAKLMTACQDAISSLRYFDLQLSTPGTEEKVFDLYIDLTVKEGTMRPMDDTVQARHSYCLRNSFPHWHRPKFIPESADRKIDPSNIKGDLLNSFVQECFRKTALRPDQIRILKNVLDCGDTIGLLPTGGGKSLCYQLAGFLKQGVTLVVDPLIALMEDQVASLKLRARISQVSALHSGRTTVKTEEIYDLLVSSIFVFISPERFLRKNFREALAIATQSGAVVSLSVVDEAHCVSMWGHDFRPAYLELAKNIRRYACSDAGPPPILALSGTASQLVLIDLSRQLGIYGSDSIIRPKTFDRPELVFRVLPAHSNMKQARLLMAIKENADRLKTQNIFEDHHGLIFGITRKSIVEGFTWLFGDKQFERIANYSPNSQASLNTSVGFFSGSCPTLDKYGEVSLKKYWSEYKQHIFEQFVNGSIKCMVANNALSVGIDHPKIRYLINLSMVGSLESYYQQAGRAGRDGLKSYCDIIFSDDEPELADRWCEGGTVTKIKGDVGTLVYFHDLNFPGKGIDSEVLAALVRLFFAQLKNSGSLQIQISNATVKKLNERIKCKLKIDDLGRFIGYLAVIGLIESYSVEGMEATTVYEIIVPEILRKAIQSDADKAQEAKRNLEEAKRHCINALYEYHIRYRPMDRQDLDREIHSRADADPNGSVLIAACHHLIDFIYERIEYQRRQAIKTMLQYCRQVAKKPMDARKLICSYFDRSEKFSDKLDELRDLQSNYGNATVVLKRIKDYEDAEQLYWETRRLLDELSREDWLFISTLAEIYLGRDSIDAECAKIMHLLQNPPEVRVNHAANLMRSLLWVFAETTRAQKIRKDIVSRILCDAYNSESTRAAAMEMLTVIVEESDIDEVDQEIFNLQMERLLNVAQQNN